MPSGERVISFTKRFPGLEVLTLRIGEKTSNLVLALVFASKGRYYDSRGPIFIHVPVHKQHVTHTMNFKVIVKMFVHFSQQQSNMFCRRSENHKCFYLILYKHSTKMGITFLFGKSRKRFQKTYNISSVMITSSFSQLRLQRIVIF